MKTVGKMTLGELAAFVCSHLRKNGIRAVLSGGACVSIYSHSRYQSSDLDFIANFSASRAKMREVLGEIGFAEHNRYFRHPDTEIFIEFPPGPLTVGEEPVKEIADMIYSMLLHDLKIEEERLGFSKTQLHSKLGGKP